MNNRILYKSSRLIVSGNTNIKLISFTYDCAFEEGITLKLLNVLEKHEVKATFFLTGLWAENYPELAKLIVSKGHEIGNHSYNHPDMTKISRQEIRQDIIKAEEIIRKATEIDTRPLFRPPYGAFNKKVLRVVGTTGYKYSIYWNIDTIDWKNPPTKVIVSRILEKANSGDIVLLHIDGKNSLEATEIAIKKLKARNFEFVTISELLNIVKK